MDSESVRRLVIEAGAVAAGVAEAAPVNAADIGLYQSWLASGRHAGMEYMERYSDVRSDPRLLLDGARSIVAAAFNYYTPRNSGAGGLKWARYALGRDYHDELRERLGRVAAVITESTGHACRVCVDTAPLRERYWAVRAGLGFTGRNGALIVPGHGSWCLLAFIITTLPLAPDAPCSQTACDGCGLCVKSCPGHALDGLGGVDARRCRSWLTIENRAEALAEPLGDRIYGCDICQEVCPHNRDARPSEIEAFTPRKPILELGRGDILSMDQPAFSTIFTRSAIKRAKLAGLRRNALNIKDSKGPKDL